MQKLRFALAALVLAALACNLPQSVGTNTPDDTPTVSPIQTTEPPVDLPTEALPTDGIPAPEAELLPAGIAVLPSDPEPDSVFIYDRTGTNLGSLPVPGMFAGSSGGLHIYGHMDDGVNALSGVYFSYQNGEQILLSTGGSVGALTDFPTAMGIMGVPGEPWVAYSQLEYSADAVRSYLYVGQVSEIPMLAPVYTVDDPEGWTIKPLRLDFDGERVTGVYFTYFPWGIGGDIVFEPRQGLFYLDVDTGQARSLMSRDYSPWDFNPALPLYMATHGIPEPMIIALSPSGPSVEVPLQADSDRGAGDGFIAPDGQHVAWKEGSGWQMAEQPNFYATIRIADAQGNLLTSFPDSALGVAAGFEVGYIRPVGWLDSSTLLLQVHGVEWDKSAVLKYDITRQSPTFYVPGEFVGFVYP